MALLNNTDRSGAVALWMRDNADDCGLTKVQLRNAMNAVDDWVEANFAGFNSALPAGARSDLTPRQKVRLLAIVLRRRQELS